MAYIELTQDEWNKVSGDMNEKVEMLTKDEVEIIASKLNEEINIPILGDRSEKKILIKIVRKIDRFLYKNLPNEIYGLVRLVEDGITDEEEVILRNRLPDLINEHVNLPFLNESTERKIFEFVLNIIIDALKKDHSISS